MAYTHTLTLTHRHTIVSHEVVQSTNWYMDKRIEH